MVLQLTIHSSWASVPVALSRILTTLAALEHPRQPGDDLSDLDDDLRELLDGIDAPEASAPAATPTAPPRPPAVSRPPATPPAATDWDGTPRTGRSLYRWACNHKNLPAVNRVGKAHGYPKRITDWEPSQVAAAYAVLTSEPEPAASANGRPR
jgi:hypothetical protein